MTERKKAEEMNRGQADPYANLLAMTSDGFFLFDLEGRLLDVNDRYCRMSGYTREELLKLRIGDLDATETPEETASHIRNIMESGFARFESKHRTKDGRILDVESTVSVWRTTGQFMTFVRDITQQKQEHEALRRIEERLQVAQHVAGIGHFDWDIQNDIITPSDELLALYGLPPGSFSETYESWRARIFAGDLEAVDAQMRESMTSGEFSCDFRIVWPDASIHWLYSHAKVFFSDDGKPLRAVGVNMDVTARHKSEEAQRRLSTAVQQAAESIVITDAQGVIEYVNPAFERITGYTSAEALGRTSRILKSGKQDDAFYKTLWSTIAAGSVWHGHFSNRRKDGSLYEEEATISPVRDPGGAITNFVAIKRDVTAEVALETQLRHAQKMEAIGILAGGIAHDFNNLLQAMLTIVELLKRKWADSPRDVENLSQLERTIRRGSYLTRQLLLFARREISKRENVDLNQILRDLSPFLRRVVRANIRLIVEPPKAPVWINADHGQIEQVVMNLALNAIDAMPGAGTLSVAAGRDEDVAWIKVSDTGTGIPEAIRDRIFEPFFTTKESGKGTGLGLSVVDGIIAAHGGQIGVECSAEGGTTFRIELPVLNDGSVVNAAAQSEEDVPNGRGERVLLVEDDQAAREGLSGILEMLGYSAVAVSTGEEALGVDQTVPFSVVLTDSMLPGIPGIEVVRELRKRWPDMKAILMSGYAAPGLIEEAVAANEFRFLQKPFDMAVLARTLRAVLQPSESPQHP